MGISAALQQARAVIGFFPVIVAPAKAWGLNLESEFNFSFIQPLRYVLELPKNDQEADLNNFRKVWSMHACRMLFAIFRTGM